MFLTARTLYRMNIRHMSKLNTPIRKLSGPINGFRCISVTTCVIGGAILCDDDDNCLITASTVMLSMNCGLLGVYIPAFVVIPMSITAQQIFPVASVIAFILYRCEKRRRSEIESWD